ncbi:cell surface A33 antigen-like isoform X2 [Girardinichthys multiradiatus]|uniref:cell surface A33 antigen-like isoform X2 n=1 Tax=Girardinichthys multiradiatus TaxID=208333 RepID=UPI001FABB865|nr:cell surface A33 antigen-like isoform X2 [Girardinichthys multiradiatus]
MESRISTLVLLCVVWSAVAALQVNIPNDQYEFARGDDITLPCTFTSGLSSPKIIVISWSATGPNTSEEDDPLILTYFHPDTSIDITTEYKNRASVDANINGASGKVDLKLSSVTTEDNKKFECRVKIPNDNTGKQADTARLTVLVAPSTPICEIQGTAEYGQNINITCYSKEGSPTPTYKWDSRDVTNMPRVADPRTTDKGGILSLYNISKDTSGYYTCTSSNKIRSASCNITLSVMPPSLKIGSTAIIAIVIAIAILILFIIIIYCCCCRKKKEDKEEYAMGVHDGEHENIEPLRKDESGPTDVEGSTQGHDDSSVSKPANQRDNYEERSERSYDGQSDYDDRRSNYVDHRKDYDRRNDRDDRRSDYDDRRSDYDDRRNDRDDRRSKNSDRHERYDDERRNNDRRDPRYDDDRYNDRNRP